MIYCMEKRPKGKSGKQINLMFDAELVARTDRLQQLFGDTHTSTTLRRVLKAAFDAIEENEYKIPARLKFKIEK